MERLTGLWNNKYLRAGLVGFITFFMARLVIAIVNNFLPAPLPWPNLLALLPAGWAAYMVSSHYRYG